MNSSFCAPLYFAFIYGPSKWIPPSDGISFLTLLTVLQTLAKDSLSLVNVVAKNVVIPSLYKESAIVL